MKPSPQIVLIFIISCFLFACTKQKWFNKVTYQGHVYDKNGNPLRGVQVQLQACGGGSADASERCPNNKFTIGTVYTDEQGHFYIHERAARSGGYFIIYGGIGWNVDAIGESALSQPKYNELYLH